MVVWSRWMHGIASGNMLVVELSRPARKFLDSVTPALADRLRDRIRPLATEPVPHDAVRVQGEPGLTYRIRIGDYRVLYRIEYEQQRILIIKIDKRGRVYH